MMNKKVMNMLSIGAGILSILCFIAYIAIASNGISRWTNVVVLSPVFMLIGFALSLAGRNGDDRKLWRLGLAANVLALLIDLGFVVFLRIVGSAFR